MKHYLFVCLALILASVSFGQTEIKVPELKGSVVIMSVSNNYGTKVEIAIEDGETVSFETTVPFDKDKFRSQHLHLVANAIQQITDQKYRLFSTEHFSSAYSSVYYFLKE